MIGTAAALAAGGLAGLLGGAAGKTETQSSAVNVGPQGALGAMGEQGMKDSYGALQGLVAAGPGQQDVAGAYGAQKDLAALLQQYSQSGGMPSQQDISSANGAANQLFGAQRVGLQQSFVDQNTDANRQAALMGRDMDDPILRAKLATEQTRQTQMLNAQQGATAQQLALQQPFQRIGLAQQHASVLGGLATQAMQNRQALLSMGQNLQQGDQTWRLQTANRTQTQQSGGGMYGAMSGLLGGLGTGMSFASGLQGLGGGGGGWNPTTVSAPALGSQYQGLLQGRAPSTGANMGMFSGASQAPSLGANFNMGAQNPYSFSLGR